MAKNYCLVSLLSVVRKIFEKLLSITLRNVALCLISIIVSGLLDQLS